MSIFDNWEYKALKALADLCEQQADESNGGNGTFPSCYDEARDEMERRDADLKEAEGAATPVRHEADETHTEIGKVTRE